MPAEPCWLAHAAREYVAPKSSRNKRNSHSESERKRFVTLGPKRSASSFAIRLVSVFQSCSCATWRRLIAASESSGEGRSACDKAASHCDKPSAKLITPENSCKDRMGVATTGRPLAKYSCSLSG